jgi:hypothetical protein
VAERVAIVGSREGADEADVRHFVTALHVKHPDIILVSGGAPGVDIIAEQLWLSLGGKVDSYRVVASKWETQGNTMRAVQYGVEKWELGVENPRVFALIEHPSFADYKSTALYRDTLISETADRIVTFQAPRGSRGAGFTAEWGEESQPKPRYNYFAKMPCE